MGKYFLKLPKMGESVAEATLITWLKEVGDTIDADESVVEIATDKVDSDVPSEFTGKLLEKRFNVDDVIKVGEVIAVIDSKDVESEKNEINEKKNIVHENSQIINENSRNLISEDSIEPLIDHETSGLIDKAESIINDSFHKTEKRFYSPLVKSIAKKENLSIDDLDNINGTGKDNRVTKKDILNFLNLKKSNSSELKNPVTEDSKSKDQLIEMSRMGKLIANHMVESKKTSAHVQSFVEVDVTNLWEWRENIKESFFKQTQEKLTFTPVFILAVIKALRDFPILNSSLQGDSILQKRDINIGMATSLSDGNLIVPVIKNADHLNLIGLTKAVNDLSSRARNNQLLPGDIKG